jgi:hypothetical protein
VKQIFSLCTAAFCPGNSCLGWRTPAIFRPGDSCPGCSISPGSTFGFRPGWLLRRSSAPGAFAPAVVSGPGSTFGICPGRRTPAIFCPGCFGCSIWPRWHLRYYQPRAALTRLRPRWPPTVLSAPGGSLGIISPGRLFTASAPVALQLL